jgi:hypothetical protein
LKVALTDCRPLRSAEDGRGNGIRPLSSFFIVRTFPRHPIPERLGEVLIGWNDDFEPSPNLRKSGDSLPQLETRAVTSASVDLHNNFMDLI